MASQRRMETDVQKNIRRRDNLAALKTTRDDELGRKIQLEQIKGTQALQAAEKTYGFNRGLNEQLHGFNKETGTIAHGRGLESNKQKFGFDKSLEEVRGTFGLQKQALANKGQLASTEASQAGQLEQQRFRSAADIYGGGGVTGEATDQIAQGRFYGAPIQERQTGANPFNYVPGVPGIPGVTPTTPGIMANKQTGEIKTFRPDTSRTPKQIADGMSGLSAEERKKYLMNLTDEEKRILQESFENDR